MFDAKTAKVVRQIEIKQPDCPRCTELLREDVEWLVKQPSGKLVMFHTTSVAVVDPAAQTSQVHPMPMCPEP